jgi:iron-sulfur cluster assembly accessory protein
VRFGPASSGRFSEELQNGSIDPGSDYESEGNPDTAEPSPTGLRVAVVGGGCSGFSYHMAFENAVNENSDSVYEFDGLKVLVDQMSEMYLDGVQIDYIETVEGSGFKFNNPNVKSTCGCGSSFSV